MPPEGGGERLAPASEPGAGRRAERRTAVLLAVAALVVYNLNCRVIQDGDTVPARLLPFALWRAGSFNLDPVAGLAGVVPPGKPYHEAYWLYRSPAGHLYSTYPIVTPVLVAPLYAPAAAFLAWRGWEPWRLQNTSLRMEKLAASLLAALSVGLFYRLARRSAARPRAILAAVAYGFATGTWVISGQALWLHGMGELLAVCALLAATALPTAGSLVAAGLAAGLLAVNRPPDAALAAAVLVYLVVRHRRRALWAVGSAASAAAPFVLYNLAVFGHWAGGYAWAVGGDHPFLSHPLLPGLAGELFSPGKGLLIFSPFLAFLACRGTRQASSPSSTLAGAGPLPERQPIPPAHYRDPLLDVAVAAAFLAQLYIFARADYRAGACYGPRYLTDFYPVLVWLLVPVVASLRGWGLRVFVAAVAAGIAIQAIGAFCYPRGRSDDRFYPPGLDRMVIAPSVWSPRNAPFLVEARAGLAPPELLPHRRGRLAFP
ncbi:MAG TPA: hypothetical protein VE075_07085 [Thermoanaerobaculia bacterium]|nr:hypothetical protein [Thermoanaerobaculia bacterium]